MLRMLRILRIGVGKLRSFSWEEWSLITFGASFLLGVGYALPMVNTITDVWAFGGGVLRSMEAYTLLPLGDVSYGTVSFYQNYIAMAIVLGINFVYNGFDIEAVKTAFILNPHYSILVPRVISALTAMVLLFVVFRFLKVHVRDVWWRLALLALLFSNVITIFLTRSGKMWILSMTLVTVSFIFLYRSLTEERQRGVPGRYALYAIIAAALATANFAFAALFFVAVPILFFAFPKTRVGLTKLLYMTLAGLGVVATFLLLNFNNIILQVSDFLPSFLHASVATVSVQAADTISLFEAIRVKGRHVIEAFPLFFIALIPAVLAGVRDRTLAFLSALYGLLYMVGLVFVFRIDHDIALNVRHVFPLGIFFMFFLAAFYPPRKFISVVLLVLSMLVYVYAVQLMMVPSTYNSAYDFVVEHYGTRDVRIDENIFELTLPMNQDSYALLETSACGSTCQHRLAMGKDISFRPLVVTEEHDLMKQGTLPPPDLLVSSQTLLGEGCKLVARFGNPVPDDEIFDIDINLGRMLMPSFYSLNRLGKNLYIYDARDCSK